MSYDEIDFAERVGDDDIDIDIDLGTGVDDEDYILEDANSDPGHDGPAISNDDVMVDEENVSYPMDDVDTLLDDHTEMEDANVSDVPVTEFNDPGIDTSLDSDAPPLLAEFDEPSEVVTIGFDSHEESMGYRDTDRLSGAHNFVEETQLIEKKRANSGSTLSPPVSPTKSDPDTQIGSNQQNLPLEAVYSSSFDTSPANKGSDGPVDTAETTAVEPEVKSSRGDSATAAVDKVIVIYRDAEYSLCSSSESDDPDTFFLKDSSLIYGPLANLLAGLREVINEDLGSEDELLIAAEDLGIEISETCMSVHDITFASVIDLHETLLKNDGVPTPGPLYITLGIKPDCAKRLAHLVAGAAEGKGMSDFVSWDEESEESEQKIGENKQVESTDHEAQDSYASVELNQKDFAATGAEEEQASDSKEKAGTEPEDAEVPEDHNEEQMLEEHGSLAVQTNDSAEIESREHGITPAQAAHVSEYAKDGLDEDGDLIDYEDEEYEQGRDNSTSANVKSSGATNENNAADGQHTQSPAPEGDEHQSDHVPPDQYHGEHPNKGNDHHDGDFALNKEHQEYERDDTSAYKQTGEEDQDGEEFQVTHDGIDDQDDGTNGDIAGEGIDLNAQDFFDFPEPDHSFDMAGTSDFDLNGIDYNANEQNVVDLEQTDHQIAYSEGDEGSKNLTAVKYDKENDEISYEEVGISGSNESERTLTADEFAPDFILAETKQGDNDEIDYDTDDGKELNNSAEQKPNVDETPVSNGLISKRQRADTDDATERIAKHSKRTRS